MVSVTAQIALIGSLPSYDVTSHVGTPENSPPPCVEFLGTGYDIVFGNPLDEQGEAFLDPGFRLPAIELLFDVRRTAGGFQEPLGTSLKRNPVCKYATMAQEVATVTAYQQLLALDVSTLNEFGLPTPINGTDTIPTSSSSSSSSSSTGAFVSIQAADILSPISPASFSSTSSSSLSDFVPSSTGYGNYESGRCPHKIGGPPPAVAPLTTAFSGSFALIDMRQNLEQKDQIAFYSRAVCAEYQVEFRSFIPPLLTENFNNGIVFLPDFVPNESDMSDKAADARTRFRAFIGEFGTHYVHRLVAGGKRVVTTLLSAASVASLRQRDVNVNLGAAFVQATGNFNLSHPDGVLGFASGTNFSYSAAESAFQSMSSQIESRIETTIGGLPFINFYGWAVTVPERLTPIQYTLKPIWSLLPSGVKRNALKTVVTAYINSAGKYPSVDNTAEFPQSMSQEAPAPTMVYNNLRPSSTSQPQQQPTNQPQQQPITSRPIGPLPPVPPPPPLPSFPLSQAGSTPAQPATSVSPVGPFVNPNRLPAGPGNQYPIPGL